MHKNTHFKTFTATAKIYTFGLFFLVIGSFPAWSQYTGKVVENATGKPIVGAVLKWGNQETITNEQGGFSLLPESATQLEVSSIGFSTLRYKPDTSKTYWEIRLVEATAELDDVVVSGNLRPMTKLSSPIPVDAYNASFFRRNPTPSFFDAVAQLNGVQSQMTCNVCNTGEIRINGLDGPYTMVLIDGMPIVSSLSTVYGLSGIPNSMVKRIEVVKGPASTLYGSEAVAGLINIITVDPLSAHRLSADVSITSWREANVDLSTQIRAGKATGLLGINYFNYTLPSDINNDNFTDIALQKRFSLFNKWSWDRKNELPASIAMRLLTENRWGGELNYNSTMKGSDAVYGESINTRRAELLGQYGLHKNLLAEYSYNYHFQDSYYGTIYYKGQQHTAFTQVRWNKQVGKHYLLAGVPFRYQWYDDNTTATTNERGGNQPSVQKMMGLFVQDEFTLHKKLTTLAGLRYEYTNLQGGVFAPRVALKWQPNAQQTVRVSGGNGFRIVNLFTEDHAALSGFRDVVITEDLKPERSWNLNVNYATKIDPTWGVINFDVSAFHTWFSNRILPDYDTDPRKIIYSNLEGSAISRGFSGNIDVVANNRIRANAGITYMDVFTREPNEQGITEKMQQVYAPNWSGTYGISYSLKNAATSIDLTGRVMGPMRLPIFPNDFRPAYSPWYNLLNVQVTKRFKHDFEMYAMVKNLLNFIPRNPILHPDDPFDRPGGKYWNTDGTPNMVTNPNGFSFDPSYNYAPMQGIRLLVGARFSLH